MLERQKWGKTGHKESCGKLPDAWCPMLNSEIKQYYRERVKLHFQRFFIEDSQGITSETKRGIRNSKLGGALRTHHQEGNPWLSHVNWTQETAFYWIRPLAHWNQYFQFRRPAAPHSFPLTFYLQTLSLGLPRAEPGTFSRPSSHGWHGPQFSSFPSLTCTVAMISRAANKYGHLFI